MKSAKNRNSKKTKAFSTKTLNFLSINPDATQLEKNDYKWVYLFLLPALIIFVLFNLIPIVTTIVTSFTSWDGFNAPKFIGLDNYINLFGNSAFLISIKNLLMWSVLAGVLHVGFGVVVAFILYERPLGWRFTRSVFMIPNVISAAAWALIFRFLFDNDMGIINTIVRFFFKDFQVAWMTTSPWAFWAITLTWLFFAVIVTLIILNDLLSIPYELIESARIDGATKWHIITKIQLPMIRRAVGTSVIASVTARVAMYEQIALTTNGGPGDDTMNLPLMLVNSINNLKYGEANTIGLIMIVYGVVALFLINKLFRMDED